MEGSMKRVIEADKEGFMAEVEQLRDQYIARSKDEKLLKRNRISYAGMAYGVDLVLDMLRDWDMKEK